MYHVSCIMYRSRQAILYLCAVCAISGLTGCAAVTECAKGVAGISTKVLEDNRATALKQAFALDSAAVYTKALGILKRMDAYVYAKDAKKPMIAVYVSSVDTTPVGIFCTAIDASNTLVEVSSPSTYARERIAKRLFAMLAGLPDPEMKEQASEE